MQVVVFGLWHLGCVTAACMAQAGNRVIGLDLDEKVVGDLKQGKPPIEEPGLTEMIGEQTRAGRLSFTNDPKETLKDAQIVWVAFDTPVNELDQADVSFVRKQIDAIAESLRPGTLILTSSQVPVGFTKQLEEAFKPRKLRFAVSPENLRLGKAIEVFQKPERVIVGVRDESDKALLAEVFAPFTKNVIWMSIESAEMTKHALNAFLATSVTFINEIARLCESLGANAREVERGLKSEARIGPKAYLGPGAAFAGGTLARDLRFLVELGQAQQVETPLFKGVLASNEGHKRWLYQHVERMIGRSDHPIVAVLGLTYKPGTNTLRRSSSVELCKWLSERGATVRAHDPAIDQLPPELVKQIELCDSPESAMAGAELAVVATEWPDYRSLTADDFVKAMARPQVIDQTWFLSGTLAQDPRITYTAAGRAK